MAISQTAQKNHDTIFPNRELVLRANDPELAELFDNFVYGEVMQYGTLDQKTRMMIILASTIAQQALEITFIFRRSDDENFADTGQHQHRQRIVNHGFIINR